MRANFEINGTTIELPIPVEVEVDIENKGIIDFVKLVIEEILHETGCHYDDEEELDIFSGCNRLKGVMEFEYDRYDMNGFMPIETSLNQYDMCFDYGASSFDHVNLYLDKGEAYLPSGCDIFKFKKVDGVWKYMGMFVGLCFH